MIIVKNTNSAVAIGLPNANLRIGIVLGINSMGVKNVQVL